MGRTGPRTGDTPRRAVLCRAPVTRRAPVSRAALSRVVSW